MKEIDVFIHIPRTGGTSLSLILLMQYGINGTYRCAKNKFGVYQVRRHLPLDRKCVLIGHVPFDVHVHLGFAKATYFTILREPFARLVSHYNYVKSNRKHYLHKQVVGRELTFEQYILNNLSPELSNGMVRQLSGSPMAWDPNADFDELYAMALYNMDKMCAVGIMEEFTLSINLFNERMQWMHPIHNNVKENDVRIKMDIDNDMLHRLKDIVYVSNEKDFMLYNYARNRFDIETRNMHVSECVPISPWKVALAKNLHRALEWI